MQKLIILFLALVTLLFVAGCASTSSTSAGTDPYGQPVSTMPWSKPQSWEGTGALGGALGR